LCLRMGGEEDLKGGMEERAQVPFEHILPVLFHRWIEICADEPYSSEWCQGGHSEHSYAMLVCPRQSEQQPTKLPFSWWLMDGLDSGLYPPSAPRRMACVIQ